MSRWGAALVSLGLIGATLEPVLRAPDDDGFPLSTFPMFAAPRPAQVAMSYARGVTEGGGLRVLALDHLGTGEVMQAFSLLQRASGAGLRVRLALCAAIATRVAADAAWKDVVAIEFVAGTYDAVEALARGPAKVAAQGAVGREAVWVRCEVSRSTP
jgi:hypothetical protein